MDGNKKKYVFNPDLSNQEKEQITGLMEAFRNNTPWISYDTLLKAILFSLVFYLIASEMVCLIFNKYLPKCIDRLLVQAVLFGIVFYIINSQI
jgi:hypothetical protein